MSVRAHFVPLVSWVAVGLFACSGEAPVSEATPEGRPNILLIVADDLGYADLGAYGGDIRTPNIDAIAGSGILFTQFHTAPSCAPTRAMLLSGNNNHVAGMGRQSQYLEGVDGYEAHLSERVAPLPRLLRDAGYHTLTVGKWHLGMAPEHGPRAAGFTRGFNTRGGAANHFNAVGIRKTGSSYELDGEPAEWPEGRYSTDLYTERLLGFIDDIDDGRPFFAFAAYTSPHWPLQVPDDELDRYAGQYDQGYDTLRVERFNSLKAAGILADNHELPPRPESIPPWENLTAEEKRREARKMELYAAMVENLDDHVGRIVAHLEEKGILENTLIFFMGDNGPDGSNHYEEGQFSEFIQANYDNTYENMGKSTSFVSYGFPWAEVSSAPFNRYKKYATQGGVLAPMIVSGHGVVSRGTKSAAFTTVMDVAPSILELAGVSYPDDGSVVPMLGESILALLGGTAERAHADDYLTVVSHSGRTFLRQGHWKLLHLESGFREEDFALYDLEADPGETTDLRDDRPEKMQHMLELWRTHRKKLGILIPADL